MTFIGTYMFLIFIGVFLAIEIGLGVFVYIDAPKYDMNKWLWILIVCFVPNLMGLIIYLVVRSNNKKVKCIKCNSEIQRDFKICPYCKHENTLKCNNCQKEISEEWAICPYCSNDLRN